MNPWYIYLSNNNFYHFLFLQRKGILQILKDNSKTSGIHLPIHSFIHLHTLSFNHSFTHSFTHSFIHSFTHSFTHSFIHSFTHSLTHSFTYSCIHSFFSLHSQFIMFFTGNALLYTQQQHSKKTPPKVRRDIREQIWYYFKWK